MLRFFLGQKYKESYSLLTHELIRLSIVAEFKKSFIGLSWLFLSPIFAIISWLVLHSAGIIEPGDTGIPYPVFVLLGTSLWAFFIEMYNRTANLIQSNSRLMLSADFPLQILVFKEVVVQLVNFSIPLVLNIIVLLVYGIKLHWISILFPLCLLPLIFLSIGIGLIAALFKIVAIDLAKLMDQGMRFLMFVTPIVYSSNIKIEWLQQIVFYNPLTYLISMPRDILTKGEFYFSNIYLLCALLSFIFFLIVFKFSSVASRRVLERLINN